ncbi:COMPASS (complex proteins associated with Set1p) component [Toensbergia leucococca]|nr:COMPASS (complex proteins associated with Set1p) component [Toensbergia leucococca]
MADETPNNMVRPVQAQPKPMLIDPYAQRNQSIPPPTTPSQPATIAHQQDIEMAEAVLIRPLKPSPAAFQQPSTTSTPAPQRTATPVRATNGHVEAPPMPTKAASHGAPVRRYLNEKITGVLLEGMKRVAAEQCVKLLWFPSVNLGC